MEQLRKQQPQQNPFNLNNQIDNEMDIEAQQQQQQPQQQQQFLQPQSYQFNNNYPQRQNINLGQFEDDVFQNNNQNIFSKQAANNFGEIQQQVQQKKPFAMQTRAKQYQEEAFPLPSKQPSSNQMYSQSNLQTPFPTGYQNNNQSPYYPSPNSQTSDNRNISNSNSLYFNQNSNQQPSSSNRMPSYPNLQQQLGKQQQSSSSFFTPSFNYNPPPSLQQQGQQNQQLQQRENTQSNQPQASQFSYPPYSNFQRNDQLFDIQNNYNSFQQQNQNQQQYQLQQQIQGQYQQQQQQQQQQTIPYYSSPQQAVNYNQQQPQQRQLIPPQLQQQQQQQLRPQQQAQNQPFSFAQTQQIQREQFQQPQQRIQQQLPQLNWFQQSQNNQQVSPDYRSNSNKAPSYLSKQQASNQQLNFYQQDKIKEKEQSFMGSKSEKRVIPNEKQQQIYQQNRNIQSPQINDTNFELNIEQKPFQQNQKNQSLNKLKIDSPQASNEDFSYMSEDSVRPLIPQLPTSKRKREKESKKKKQDQGKKKQTQSDSSSSSNEQSMRRSRSRSQSRSKSISKSGNRQKQVEKKRQDSPQKSLKLPPIIGQSMQINQQLDSKKSQLSQSSQKQRTMKDIQGESMLTSHYLQAQSFKWTTRLKNFSQTIKKGGKIYELVNQLQMIQSKNQQQQFQSNQNVNKSNRNMNEITKLSSIPSQNSFNEFGSQSSSKKISKFEMSNGVLSSNESTKSNELNLVNDMDIFKSVDMFAQSITIFKSRFKQLQQTNENINFYFQYHSNIDNGSFGQVDLYFFNQYNQSLPENSIGMSQQKESYGIQKINSVQFSQDLTDDFFGQNTQESLMPLSDLQFTNQFTKNSTQHYFSTLDTAGQYSNNVKSLPSIQQKQFSIRQVKNTLDFIPAAGKKIKNNDEFIRELFIMQTVKCDYMPMLFGQDLEKQILFMELGLCNLFDLKKDSIKRNYKFSDEFTYQILINVICAIESLLSYRDPQTKEHMPMFHSDIKPQNIILTAKKDKTDSNCYIQLLLIDYGGASFEISDYWTYYTPAFVNNKLWEKLVVNQTTHEQLTWDEVRYAEIYAACRSIQYVIIEQNKQYLFKKEEFPSFLREYYQQYPKTTRIINSIFQLENEPKISNNYQGILSSNEISSHKVINPQNIIFESQKIFEISKLYNFFNTTQG